MLVGEEAGEGLAEAADGLSLGLVISEVPSQRLREGVGQGLGFAVKGNNGEITGLQYVSTICDGPVCLGLGEREMHSSEFRARTERWRVNKFMFHNLPSLLLPVKTQPKTLEQQTNLHFCR